jgi:hypothetical protein
VSGLAGRDYKLLAVGGENITAIQGATRDGDSIVLTMPSGNGYVQSNLKLHLR